jgi:hypothetical protein
MVYILVSYFLFPCVCYATAAGLVFSEAVACLQTKKPSRVETRGWPRALFRFVGGEGEEKKETSRAASKLQGNSSYTSCTASSCINERALLCV